MSNGHNQHPTRRFAIDHLKRVSPHGIERQPSSPAFWRARACTSGHDDADMTPASYSADRRCASTIHCSLGAGHSAGDRLSHSASIKRICSVVGRACAASKTLEYFAAQGVPPDLLPKPEPGRFLPSCMAACVNPTRAAFFRSLYFTTKTRKNERSKQRQAIDKHLLFRDFPLSRFRGEKRRMRTSSPARRTGRGR